MVKRKRTIRTNNREVYEKLNMLNFSSEVLLKDVKPIQINKIVSNINKKNKFLDIERVGNYILVKKINPIRFNIYFNHKK